MIVLINWLYIQIVTVRSTAFEAASTSGGSGTIEDTATPADLPSVSEYVGQSLTKSDRPDLASAKVTPKLLKKRFSPRIRSFPVMHMFENLY